MGFRLSAARKPAEVFEIESPYAGRLAVCMRPRGGMWLADDIRRLRTDGWDVLVSALMPGEVAELHLGAAPRLCNDHGVEFFSFPIGNLQVPLVDHAATHFDLLRGHLSGRQYHFLPGAMVRVAAGDARTLLASGRVRRAS